MLLSVIAVNASIAANTQAEQRREVHKARETCASANKAIVFYRQRTWEYQISLGQSKTTDPNKRSCSSKRRAAKVWQTRAKQYRAQVEKLNNNPRAAICYVFKRYCRQALGVAGCETGGTYSVNAQNGQYLGLFQMGSYERATFGHGPTALEQAFSALAYFIRSGRDWSPWSCRWAAWT